ncbi:hypothetical protein L0244_16105, partial [bacterium]|nr:hypothetical protein [bacterium]
MDHKEKLEKTEMMKRTTFFTLLIFLILLQSVLLAQTRCLRCPSIPVDDNVMVGNGGIWVSTNLCTGGALQYDPTTNSFSCGTITSAAGWTDDGTEVRLTTSTDDVEIGSAGTLAAKFAINGDSNEIQALIQENATQTVNGFVYENSAGTDLFAIEGGGDIEIGSSGTIAAKLAVNGNADEIQFNIQENATQTSHGFIYEDSSGVDLVAIEGGGDVEIGSAGSLSAKLGINGTADEAQLLVQGNGTQTANLFEIENSSANNKFVVESDGDVEVGSGVGGMFSAKFAIDGDADET